MRLSQARETLPSPRATKYPAQSLFLNLNCTSWLVSYLPPSTLWVSNTLAWDYSITPLQTDRIWPWHISNSDVCGGTDVLHRNTFKKSPRHSHARGGVSQHPTEHLSALTDIRRVWVFSKSLSKQSRGLTEWSRNSECCPVLPSWYPAFEFQLCGGLGGIGQQGVSASAWAS